MLLLRFPEDEPGLERVHQLSPWSFYFELIHREDVIHTHTHTHMSEVQTGKGLLLKHEVFRLDLQTDFLRGYYIQTS